MTRRTAAGWPAVSIALLLACGLAACSGSRSRPPEVAPRTEIVEPADVPTVADLSAEAERHYRLGVDAQDAGDQATAEKHFDAALKVFMEADVPQGEDEGFRTAFNEIATRVQAREMAALQLPVEPEATELAQQEIPVLSPAEIEMLRTRLADTLPALPRFSIPVPADHPKVLAALEYLTTNRKDVVQEGLSRATRYLPLILETFEEEGVPSELAWIPLIESLFKPWVRSRASAVGLWQLMAPTARLYGLRVDWYVDERRDPVKATRAIARFIKDYYAEFGDWHLAIAAYNGGKGRVGRALRRAGVSDFWSLAETRNLPRETREFVPKILAAILIGTEPHAYGLEYETLPPYEYESVTIDSMTDLEVIAEAAGTTLETIQELNPALLRRATPNVDSFEIRVPPGTGTTFREAYAAIPPSQRLRVVEHRIGQGQTLSGIADSYGISVAAVADFNGIRNRHRIRAGQTILIPMSQASARSASTVARADLRPGSDLETGEQVTHVVRRGESLWTIARAYGTTVAAIKRWNGIAGDHLDQGQSLRVYYRTTRAPTAPRPARAVSAAAENIGGGQPPATAHYTVRRGDTLVEIARLHGVDVQSLKRWNGIGSDRIYPGDELVIRGGSGRSIVETSYTIRRGDTLTAIANRFGVTVRQICDWNDISPRTTLYPGRRLTIRSSVDG